MIADPDELAAALAAGTNPTTTWTQIHVGSTAIDVPRLRDAIETVVHNCGIEDWHYVLKPPAVRVRFAAELDDVQLEPIAELGDTRIVTYEPEQFRFGGPDGLALAHSHFTADARWALEVLTEGRLGFDRVEWSMIVSNDLAVRIVGDRAELWDLWKRLEEALGAAPSPTTAANETDPGPGLDPDRVAEVLNFGVAFIDGLSDAGHRLIASAREVNAATASALDELASTVAPRAWLAAVTVFHWNRLALTPDELRPLTQSVLRLLDGP